MSPNQQFVIALVLIGTLVVIAWLFIESDLIAPSDSAVFYSNFVQGLIILGAAFFGVPVSWRAGKSSGKVEGQAEAQRDKHDSLREQRRKIAEQASGLTRAAHEAVRNATTDRETSAGGQPAIQGERAPRRSEVSDAHLNEAQIALARLDQLMTDLQV